MRRIVNQRFDEACALSAALERCDARDLHRFRIACKRLRYALERCEAVAPVLAASAPQLALLADALGEAHDRDVLLGGLPAGMPRTRARIVEERERAARRGAPLWNDACVLVQESLRYYEAATPCSVSADSRG
jgi:CHAD domain-containing protein